MADIVDDFMQRLLAMAPGLAESPALPMLEAELRHTWGGTEPYVAKRPGQWRQLVIGQQLQQGAPLADAIARAGVSRAQGYRVLRRTNKCKR
jgi:hypothetical protein